MPLRFLPLLALFALAGCGGSVKPPKTVPVSGTVLKGTRPAAGVTVTFHPQFDTGPIKWQPSGTTDREGKFTLSTGAPDNGAPAGEYKVTFELLRAGADQRGLDTEIDAWKGKYANLGTAPTVTVGKTGGDLDPFRLE